MSPSEEARAAQQQNVHGGANARIAKLSSSGSAHRGSPSISRTASPSIRALSNLALTSNLMGDKLMPELWLYIFSYLSPRTLACSCASVSKYWASLALESVKDREFAQHETFMLSQPRLLVGMNRYCQKLNEYLRSSDAPLVVSSESGGGKSSLLIQWIQRFYRENKNTLVLYHFVGSPAHSTDYTNILHRLMAEIKRECRIHDDVPSTLSNLQKKFPQVLHLPINCIKKEQSTLPFLCSGCKKQAASSVSSSSSTVSARSRAFFLKHKGS